MDYTKLTRIIDFIEDTPIGQKVQNALEKVGLVLYEDMDGTKWIGLADHDYGKSDSVVAFSDAQYNDYKEWFPNGDDVEVSMATPEQQKVFESFEDEISYLEDNGYWRDDPEYGEAAKYSKD